MFATPTRALAAAGTALALAGCAPELNWREWQSAEAGVRQMFPCKPVRQQRQAQVAGRSLTLVLHVCDAGGVSWALAHAQVEDPSAVNAVLQAMAQAATANLGSAPMAPAAWAVRGATPQAAAGVLRISGRGPDGKPMAMATSLFARGTVVVQVTALGPSLAHEGVETFLQSSRVGP